MAIIVVSIARFTSQGEAIKVTSPDSNMEVPEVCAVFNQSIGTLSKEIRGVQVLIKLVKKEETLFVVYLDSWYTRNGAIGKPDQTVKRECKQSQYNSYKHWQAYASVSTKQFNFRTDCYFCGEPAIADKKERVQKM